jgi:hypothetical protein
MNELNTHKEELQSLCKKLKIKSLYAFGSVVKNVSHDYNDLDFIVNIVEEDPISYSDKYFDLKENLKSIFDKPIDLLEEKAITNPHFLNAINKYKVKIYES